jgi:hypothetical protein
MRLPGPVRDALRPFVERGRRIAQRVSRWIRPWQEWNGMHHAVLADFEPWSGETDGTWVYDSLGVRTEVERLLISTHNNSIHRNPQLLAARQ